MFCSECGTMLPEGARFCPECGVTVTPESEWTGSAQTTEIPTGTADGKAAKRKSRPWLWMPVTGIALGVVLIALMERKPELFGTLSAGRSASSERERERSKEYEEDAPDSDEAKDGAPIAESENSPQSPESEDSQSAGEPLAEETAASGDSVADAENIAGTGDGATDAENPDGYEEDAGVYDDGEGEIKLVDGVIGRTTYLVDDIYHQVLQLEPDGTFTLDVNLLEGMGQVYGTYEYSEKEHCYEFFVDGRDFRGFQGDDVWGFRMEPESACLVYSLDYYYIGMVSSGMKFYLTDTPPENANRWDSDSVMQYGDLDLLDYLGEYSGWSDGNEIMVDIWWRDEESVNIGIYWFQGSDEVRRHTFFVEPTNLGGNVVRFVTLDDEWHRLEIIPGYASESGYATIFLDGDETWPIVLVDIDNQPT